VARYGCESWSFAQRKVYRLIVFDNRMLKRKFGPKREEVAEGWRRLHNEDFHNLYAS